MPDCSNPTCLSIHWGKTKAAPRKFNICFCLTTSQPLNERPHLCGKVKQHASKSAALSQALQEDLTALCCNIHETNSMESQRQNQHLIHEHSSLPELDPQLLLNQGECDRSSHVAHQLLAAGLCWAPQVLATNQGPPGRALVSMPRCSERSRTLEAELWAFLCCICVHSLENNRGPLVPTKKAR